MSISTYKELKIWQKAMVLVSDVYTLTQTFPKEEKFGLINQMRRSSVSIPSNIAEGWGRSTKSFVQFLRVSRGSLFELETQILISKQLDYTNNSEEIEKLIIEISKMLNSLIRKLEEKN